MGAAGRGAWPWSASAKDSGRGGSQAPGLGGVPNPLKPRWRGLERNTEAQSSQAAGRGAAGQ